MRIVCSSWRRALWSRKTAFLQASSPTSRTFQACKRRTARHSKVIFQRTASKCTPSRQSTHKKVHQKVLRLETKGFKQCKTMEQWTYCNVWKRVNHQCWVEPVTYLSYCGCRTTRILSKYFVNEKCRNCSAAQVESRHVQQKDDQTDVLQHWRDVLRTSEHSAS